MEIYHRLVKVGNEYTVISIERDIFERRRMQERLMIADRLASIGELASGVAHEVNNPLTSVIGFSELLLEQPLSADVKSDLTTIRDEAKRAAGVVKNLLTFARKQAPLRQPVNLNDIVKKVLELRAYEENINNIRVITRFAPDLKLVMADASQLQQVFFNIMTNAEFFMIETHHKGTLTITTENIDNIVRASFTDDGPGMSADTLAHLFTPFFTTKPVGKGTGLGLSICHGIMASHEGKMYAESKLGEGATFIVELPASDL
jgi:signal transduction histidine kinase